MSGAETKTGSGSSVGVSVGVGSVAAGDVQPVSKTREIAKIESLRIPASLGSIAHCLALVNLCNELFNQFFDLISDWSNSLDALAGWII